MDFLAQSIFSAPSGSPQLWTLIVITFLLGIGMIAGLTFLPSNLRRPLIITITFVAGLVYFAWWIWPQPIDRGPNELPRGFAEGIGFWLEDALPVIQNISNVVVGFLIGLGIYSLLRIHLTRFVKMHKDWFFSMVLILGIVIMFVFAMWDWYLRKENTGITAAAETWGWVNYAQDLLFQGLYLQMDATMFSLIAFFILSAAYRAFRIRSIESTILMTTALIFMLSLLGAAEFQWNGIINGMSGNNAGSFLQNFQLTEISRWLRDTIQTPSLRAIDFGLATGALAISLRIWLSLEKGAVN